MPRRAIQSAAAALVWASGALAMFSVAHAGVLYRCEGPNGSIAYTNKTAAFSKCIELSRYADEAPKPAVVRKPVSHAPVAEAELAAENVAEKTATSANGWQYRENIVEKADAKATSSGVTSTALPLRAASFGVESTATLVRTAAVSPPISETMIAKAAAPASLPMKPVPKILRGAVYRVQRTDGITEYTNVKPNGGAFAVLFTYIATCVACDVHSKINFARTALNLDAYKNEITAAAASYGVDVSLLRAVIHAESAFNPMAVSNKGAQGLMQLMPGTAGDLGVTDAFDASQNIEGGAKYLSQLLKNFNGNTQLATAAYNAGAGAVQKYGGVPPYDETQVYVERVETLRDRYQKAL